MCLATCLRFKLDKHHTTPRFLSAALFLGVVTLFRIRTLPEGNFMAAHRVVGVRDLDE